MWIRALERCGASGVVLTPGTVAEVTDHDGRVLTGAGVAVEVAPPAPQPKPVTSAPRRRRSKAKG